MSTFSVWRTQKASIYAFVIITFTIGMFFLQTPTGGAFYWSDAPRHALNGVFIKDMVQALPWGDPAGYAYNYYAKYPALTILFYPPLFYVISAPFFWIFGVSHTVSLWVVYVHYVAFGFGVYQLARLWMPPLMALACSIMLVATPEIAFWGRQVMLEIPAFAFLVWSAFAFCRYRQNNQSFYLYLTVLLLVFAMYTKISTVFVAPVYVVVLAADRGWRLFKNKHIILATILGFLSIIPLVVLTLKFGQANVQSVTGITDSAASRTTIAGWLWYLRQLPGQIGWPILVACVCGFLSSVVLFARKSDHRPAKQALVFLLLWFLIGYVFFSAIDLKEARHSVYLLLPVVFIAAIGLNLGLSQTSAQVVLLFLALVTAVHTALYRPVYFVDGYAQAVDFVAKNAAENSVVMFSGYRDGAFTFNMRTREDRKDLSVLRADKLLLKVAVRRELGVGEKSLSQAEIASSIGRYGVEFVVMQPGFWTDLEAMRRLESVLKSDQFVEVKRIQTKANFVAQDKELVIYKNLGAITKGPIDLKIDLPIIGKTIGGSVGSHSLKN